jgi:hypothetical protein
MAMIDTVRSRIDFETFSSLHSENLLPRRAPIGDRDQIVSWAPGHLREFYRSHYRPQNAKLYLSGNFDPNIAEELISKKLGTISNPCLSLSPSPPLGLSLKLVNRHFPPVVHRWTGVAKDLASDLSRHLSQSYQPSDVVREMLRDLSQPQSLPSVKVIPTPSREEVTIRIFAKKPLLPLSSLSDFQRDFTQRVVQRIFQIRSISSPPLDIIYHARLHHLRRHTRDPLFSGEFFAHHSVKEGCVVLDLSLKAHVDHWRRSLREVIQEVWCLLEHGVLDSEWQRCQRSLLESSLLEMKNCATSPEVSSSLLLTNSIRFSPPPVTDRGPASL